MKPIQLVPHLVLPLLASFAAAQGSQPVRSFRPLASLNLSGVAEIVDATPDGRTLVYTNAALGVIGFVDITNPAQPSFLSTLAVGGEPTSVSIIDNYALVTVWVDSPVIGQPPPLGLPGHLVVVDVANPQAPAIVGHRDIGYHPDSVKAKKIGNEVFAVIAIENEPIVVVGGLVTSNVDPGSPNDVGPPGYIEVVRVDLVSPASSVVIPVALPLAAMQAAGCLYPHDPQPEFVAWHGDLAAVTLQENNGVAIVNMAIPILPSLQNIFSSGVVAPRPADLVRNARIQFTNTYPTQAPAAIDGGGNPVPAGSRFSDAIAFSPDGSTLYTADEGEMAFTGGRGFSWWLPNGTFVGDDGGSLEHWAVVFSHYPEARSQAKGIEAEGITTARFGNHDYLFVSSERGSFCAVYSLENPAQPQFVQLLPTGLAPEGLLAIPSRRLLVTAEETSGTLTLFEGVASPPAPSKDQPQLYSDDMGTPWAAISGLCPGDHPQQFFAVPDNALPTVIVSIETGQSFAPVRPVLPVLRSGVQATYDGEGICRDTSIVAPENPGFWIASEGNGTNLANMLVQVDGEGSVVREIQMPFAVDGGAQAGLGGTAQGPASGSKITSNGFEGCCLSTDGRFLFAAIQREFTGEFATGTKYARIARYDLQQVQTGTAPVNGLRTGGDWQFFYFAFDTNDPVNWPGLSEITCVATDKFIVIERDKGIGIGSTLKKLYGFSIAGLTPDSDGLPGVTDTVTKVLVLDIVKEFSPYEKIEGIGVLPTGALWVALDNDGGAVESRLRFLGKLKLTF
jgi:hypothetical protein